MRAAKSTAFGITILLALSCCDRTDIDSPAPYTPSPAGNGSHIRDISNPASPLHAAPNSTINVTGTVVTVVDEYDETHDGKSRGTIYVQDLESSAPFSAISLFSPTFVPASLVVGPGDVVDLNGEYQESNTIGTTVTFPNGEVLPQISKPSGTFRYEYQAPAPTPINLSDLAAYSTGRQWLGQVVTVTNVTLATAVVVSSGRQSAQLLPSGPTGSDEAPTLTNELMQLDSYGAGQQFKSITGVVTYFYNLQIAPRTAADLVTE